MTIFIPGSTWKLKESHFVGLYMRNGKWAEDHTFPVGTVFEVVKATTVPELGIEEEVLIVKEVFPNTDPNSQDNVQIYIRAPKLNQVAEQI